MKKLPVVKDYMAVPAFTLSPGMSIHDAIDFFINHKISGAPVVDAHDKLVGIISEKDCLKLIARSVNQHPSEVKVADLMTKKVVTILPGMDIYYAAGIFLRNVYRRLPVVENAKVIGQISRRDVLRAIYDIYSTVKFIN